MTRLISLAVCVIVLLSVSTPSLATIISYNATLDGVSSGSPATGSALVDYDNIARTLHVQANFSGLLGTTTASHIHSPTLVPGTGNAGVATTTPTFPGFPTGVTSGTYNNLLDLTQVSSWNPSYVTAQGGTTAAAEAALASSLAAGTAYFNIHTTSFTGGEIRGFLTPIPEPATLSLLALGMIYLKRHIR
jgi:hypothetical protein